MEFSVYVPPQAADGPCPVVTWLSGLTCTWENATTKAGFQGPAAEAGLVVVCPDTSPRGLDLPGEHASYDFGSGAGFYVDATEAPWSANYRMYRYVTEELPALIARHFPVDPPARASSATPWAATARSPWRSRTPAPTARSPPSPRSARP
jgi:S-formylglutathione hydrolase